MGERMKSERLSWWKEQQRSGKLGHNFECLIRDFQTERDYIAELKAKIAKNVCTKCGKRCMRSVVYHDVEEFYGVSNE
jgi:transcription elongation factor Elf1